MSSGLMRAFALVTMIIKLSPPGSTAIGATPEETSFAKEMCVVSIPKERKFASISSPKVSRPSFVTMLTRAPSFAITAWFAPLPPYPIRKSLPCSVSLSRGARS